MIADHHSLDNESIAYRDGDNATMWRFTPMIRLLAQRAQPYLGTLLLCFVGLWGSPARADVVTMKDSRRFEGTVHSEQDGVVQFDTVVSGIRARLSLQKAEIKSIDKKPHSQPTQDPVEIDPGLSGVQQRPDEVTLYLEVPIKGRFKEKVFAAPIRSTLAYARLHGVKHIVFSVDCTGGPADEAGAIYKTLRQFENEFTYHAIVANCVAEAIVVPFLCRTIYLQPGATVGGLNQPLESLPARFAAKEEEVVRAQIADDLAEVARQRGRKGEIIKAMVDPTVRLAAWIDDQGDVELGQSPPPGLPDDRVLFSDGPDNVLVLSFEQATRLGVPSITGGPAAIGPVLGLPDWREESSYGRDTMNKAIAAKQRRENNAQTRFEDAVSRNIRMRELTSRAIETNLQQAASWNPTTASYKNLSVYWNAVWWDPGQEWNTNLWTPDSRLKWQSRSDACASFLVKARDGITSMIKLDKEAVTLGLSPSFKEGDLSAMQDDVNVKLRMLSIGRNRAGE
jgi:hypothetical protein